jgi:diadenosine tetraphosphate (Ap4A) HIT family hydrolase
MTSRLDHLWSGWRSAYIGAGGASHNQCVFCGLLESDAPSKDTHIVWRDDLTAVILNAFPYGTGHVLVMPIRHVGELDNLETNESEALWRTTQLAARAINDAYQPDGMNIGANLGSAAGAGIPEHLHMHALPRWKADTNFSTAIANTRVLPEALDVTWEKLTAAWPVSV